MLQNTYPVSGQCGLVGFSSVRMSRNVVLFPIGANAWIAGSISRVLPSSTDGLLSNKNKTYTVLNYAYHEKPEKLSTEA